MTEDFRYGLQESLGNAGESNNQFSPDTPGQQHAFATPPAPGERVLPILLAGKPAVQFDRTAVPENWNLVNIYDNTRDGVVKIVGKRDVVDNAGRRMTETVTGSGFFVTPDGKIATDFHVVDGLKGIEIITANGRRYSATIENVNTDVDKANDLAIVKVTNAGPLEQFKALPLGDPNFGKGDGVVAIGYPRGWEDMYVSPGVYNLSQPLSKVVKIEHLGQAENGNRLVHDLSIHVEPGNSGGPLISKDGRAVGVIATTDAHPDNADDLKSIPGKSAEATPIEAVVALLNRSSRITGPPLAGTIGLDSVPPYYAPPLPTGDIPSYYAPPLPNGGSGLATSWQRTPLRRSFIGFSDYPGTAASTGRSEFNPLPFSVPGLPDNTASPSLYTPPVRRSYFGGRVFGANHSGAAERGTAVDAADAAPAPVDQPAPLAGLAQPAPVADQAQPADVPTVQLTPDLPPPEQPPHLTHTLAHGFNVYNQVSILRSQQPGPLGSVFSVGLGGFDLVTGDFDRLKRAYNEGTSRDLLWAGLNAGADVLLVGGGIAGFSSKYRLLGGIAATGGSAIKLVSDGNSYYKHFR